MQPCINHLELLKSDLTQFLMAQEPLNWAAAGAADYPFVQDTHSQDTHFVEDMNT